MEAKNKQLENYPTKGENEMFQGVLTWVQHRPRMVIGALIGFFLVLLFKWLGLWYTLLLLLFVAIGAIVGKYLDERKEVGQVLDRLFTSDQ